MTPQAPQNDVAPQEPSSINDILRAQLDALRRIEAILADEHAALAQRNPDMLLNAADAKTAALTRLGELEAKRRSLSCDLDSGQIRALRDVASRCARMNKDNAALLNARQHHVGRLLNLLRGSRRDDRPSSYDATGRTARSSAAQLRLTQA